MGFEAFRLTVSFDEKVWENMVHFGYTCSLYILFSVLGNSRFSATTTTWKTHEPSSVDNATPLVMMPSRKQHDCDLLNLILLFVCRACGPPAGSHSTSPAG